MRCSCKVRILYIVKETRINMVFQTSKIEEFSRILWVFWSIKSSCNQKVSKSPVLGFVWSANLVIDSPLMEEQNFFTNFSGSQWFLLKLFLADRVPIFPLLWSLLGNSRALYYCTTLNLPNRFPLSLSSIFWRRVHTGQKSEFPHWHGWVDRM